MAKPYCAVAAGEQQAGTGTATVVFHSRTAQPCLVGRLATKLSVRHTPCTTLSPVSISHMCTQLQLVVLTSCCRQQQPRGLDLTLDAVPSLCHYGHDSVVCPDRQPLMLLHTVSWQDIEPGPDYNIHHCLLGEHTSGAANNHLMVAGKELIDPFGATAYLHPCQHSLHVVYGCSARGVICSFAASCALPAP